MEAWLYDTMQNQRVRCRLCNHYCVIGNGKRGICGVRENRDGVLETGVYGRLIAAGDDPIEKKPIFHLMPGSRSFSIATVGCNFKCRFCQNADIAQMPADRDGRITGDLATPEQVVAPPGNAAAPASPTPTPNRPFFSSLPATRRSWPTARGSKTYS
jgi:pyruvate formate lyase activating enzyme